MPHWFADVVYPSHIYALWYSLGSLWLKGAFHSSLLSVTDTISLWLQRDIWKEMFGEEKKKCVCGNNPEKDCLLVFFFFSCSWYNRLKILWYNCFSVGHFFFFLYKDHKKKLAVRKKTAVWSQSRCCHLRVDLSKSRQASNFPSLSRVLGSSWNDVHDSDSDFFISGLSVVAYAKACTAPCCISSHKVNKKSLWGLVVPFQAVGNIT